jgi:type IV pilus assembly protein PilQ
MKNVDVGFGGATTPPGIPAAGAFNSAAGGAAGFTFGKLGVNAQLDLRLSASAIIGETKTISSPKVLTLNNKTAKISQGQQIPYKTQTAEQITTIFVEAALTLEVTPHIAADGTITMKIKATNDSAGVAIAGADSLPINKQEASTEVTVLNGETVVIGGIYTDSSDVTNSGVPFLMDIPLLGWLFKSNQADKNKKELLIFITPKIVS